MRIFLSENLQESISDKHVLFDNDFMGLIFNNEDVFSKILKLLSHSVILIDPYTEFEFLRDIFLPKERILREQFLNFNVFIAAPKNQEIFVKIQENALLLSKIYAHQNSKAKPSSIDLLLAGRLMYNKNHSCLVTGNKKDFPSCVFTTLGTIAYEDSTNGNIRSYAVVEFSEEKFDEVYSNFQTMNIKGEKELAQELDN